MPTPEGGNVAESEHHAAHVLTSTGDDLDPGAAKTLSELARDMQAREDPDAILQLIVEAAVSEIEGADWAGTMLVTKGRPRTQTYTDDIVMKLDDLQRDANDGPCLTSLREETTVRADDLADEPRWPRFTSGAVEYGVRSMLSAQLFVREENLGALNLFSGKPHAFDHDSEQVTLLLASHAAVALVDARKIQHLKIALESRDLIGQAKGILMERFKVDASAAFGILVAISQHTHRKLHVVAEDLAATGELPDVVSH